MIRRSTWILLAIFVVVLAAGYYFQFGGGEGGAEATPTADTGTNIDVFEGIDATSVMSLRIEDHTGRILQMRRDAEGEWSVSEPPEGITDPAKADKVVEDVLALRTLAPLNPMDDMGVYGLTSPIGTISLTLEGGDAHVLLVGDKAPTGNGYYVRLDSNPPQIVYSYSVDAILGHLNNPPFEPTPTPESEITPETAGTETPEP